MRRFEVHIINYKGMHSVVVLHYRHLAIGFALTMAGVYGRKVWITIKQDEE